MDAMRRFPLYLGVLIVAAILVVALLRVVADERCRVQMTDGPNSPGSNCGYQLSGAPDEFRYAIDAGSQRILYLSGGTAAAPLQMRLLRGDDVVVQRTTELLQAGRNIDVCRNAPPRDPRWWSAAINDEIASAIRTGDGSAYRLEGLIDGRWQTLRLHGSGCAWKGHG